MTAQEPSTAEKLATAATATKKTDSELQPRRSKRLISMEINDTPKSPGRRCNPRHGELKPGKSLLKPDDDQEGAAAIPQTIPSAADDENTTDQIGFYSWTDLLRSQARARTRTSTKKKTAISRGLKKTKQLSNNNSKKVNWDIKHLEW
jgi:hypothetical protein